MLKDFRKLLFNFILQHIDHRTQLRSPWDEHQSSVQVVHYLHESSKGEFFVFDFNQHSGDDERHSLAITDLSIEDIEALIEKDVPGTFPAHELFKSEMSYG